MDKHIILNILLSIALLGLAALAEISLNSKPATSTNDIPLPNTANRPQLLTFGMFVTPDAEQNPIDPPERFIGYHTALDLEIAEDEETADVPVRAVCDGHVAKSGPIEGYGGVVIQHCTLHTEPVTVLYGHLDLTSLSPEGTHLKQGQQLAMLAPATSTDSGFTRKHLHLSIHKGTDIEVRGYVQSKAELEQFLDPKKALGL